MFTWMWLLKGLDHFLVQCIPQCVSSISISIESLAVDSAQNVLVFRPTLLAFEGITLPKKEYSRFVKLQKSLIGLRGNKLDSLVHVHDELLYKNAQNRKAKQPCVNSETREFTVHGTVCYSFKHTIVSQKLKTCDQGKYPKVYYIIKTFNIRLSWNFMLMSK